MKRYFITATGTDIGKTFVTAALTWQLRAKGLRVKALKPVVSGFDAEQPNDSRELLAAQELLYSEIDSISPWRLRAPLSPDMAARQEGKAIALADVVAFCSAGNEAQITLIEGVGGVMSPINDQCTVLDWIEQLSLPVILVTGSYVGTLSHTLTALHVLKSRAIPIKMLVINESPGSAATLAQTKQALEGANCDIRLLHRLDSAGEVWKNAPDLTEGLL